MQFDVQLFACNAFAIWCLYLSSNGNVLEWCHTYMCERRLLIVYLFVESDSLSSYVPICIYRHHKVAISLLLKLCKKMQPKCRTNELSLFECWIYIVSCEYEKWLNNWVLFTLHGIRQLTKWRCQDVNMVCGWWLLCATDCCLWFHSAE